MSQYCLFVQRPLRDLVLYIEVQTLALHQQLFENTVYINCSNRTNYLVYDKATSSSHRMSSSISSTTPQLSLPPLWVPAPPPPPLAPPNPKLPILLAKESPTASTAPFGLLKLISPCRFAILNSLIEVPAHRPLLPRLFCASCAKMKPQSMDMYQPKAREDHVNVWRRMAGVGSKNGC